MVRLSRVVQASGRCAYANLCGGWNGACVSNIPSPELIIATLAELRWWRVQQPSLIISRTPHRRVNGTHPKSTHITGRVLVRAPSPLDYNWWVRFAILWFAVNPLTAWLNFASWADTASSIHISSRQHRKYRDRRSIRGTPLFGWTAVTNSIDPQGIARPDYIYLDTTTLLVTSSERKKNMR